MHTLYYTQCGKLAKYFDGRFSVSKKLHYWIVVHNLNWFKVLNNVGFINPKTTVHLVPVILKHFAIWYGKLFAFAPWIFSCNVYLLPLTKLRDEHCVIKFKWQTVSHIKWQTFFTFVNRYFCHLKLCQNGWNHLKLDPALIFLGLEKTHVVKA